MTRPELRKLDRIIAQSCATAWTTLYNTAKAACDATERA
jgi:hypothetical protein